MNNEQMGKFLKKLRKEKGISQYELADILGVPRSSISKWERGNMNVTSKNLALLSEFYGVTTDELMAGERNKKGLSEKVNDLTLNMLDNNIKLHKLLKYTIAVIIILVVSFLVYYFYTFYNSVKIYTIHLDSDKYIAKYGQLTKTSDKIYFYLDINYLIEDLEEIESVKLYYTSGSKSVTLGEATDTLPFSFVVTKGYNELIKFDEFDDAIKSMHMYVNFKDGNYESVDIKIKREYSNTKVLPNSDKEVDDGFKESKMSNEDIKVYERFLEVKDIIEKHGKDNMMDLKFEGKVYHIEILGNELNIYSYRDDARIMFKYSYYNKELFYLNSIDNNGESKLIYSFDIQMGKCLEGKCENHMDNYREMIRLINEIVYEY